MSFLLALRIIGAKVHFGNICNNCKGKGLNLGPNLAEEKSLDAILIIFMPYTKWPFDFFLFKIPFLCYLHIKLIYFFFYRMFFVWSYNVRSFLNYYMKFLEMMNSSMTECWFAIQDKELHLRELFMVFSRIFFLEPE